MADDEVTLDTTDVSARLTLPSRQQSPLRLLSVRVLIALGCIAVTTILVYLERDGYSDSADGIVTWLDALYYATVTLSTTGYGDISPVSDQARLTNIFVITPLRFVFLITLVGTALETLTQRTRYEWRAQKWRRKVKQHTLVVGFGVKGRAAVRSVLDAGTPPERVVVITTDPEGAQEAKRMGLAAIIGDGRRDEVLMDAGVERASRIIVATDADDTSVLVTLTARRLAPGAHIVSAARESANAQILRDSGADGVIVTAEAAGRLLSMQLLSPYAGDVMEDLLDTGRGLEMVEREVTPEELGLGVADLEARGEIVVAVIRNGQMARFDSSTIKVLQRNDKVVVIRERPGLKPTTMVDDDE